MTVSNCRGHEHTQRDRCGQHASHRHPYPEHGCPFTLRTRTWLVNAGCTALCSTSQCRQAMDSSSRSQAGAPASTTIRDAAPEDLPQLVEIYNHYVIHTPITFDLAPVSLAQRAIWMQQFASGTSSLARSGARFDRH